MSMSPPLPAYLLFGAAVFVIIHAMHNPHGVQFKHYLVTTILGLLSVLGFFLPLVLVFLHLTIGGKRVTHTGAAPRHWQNNFAGGWGKTSDDDSSNETHNGIVDMDSSSGLPSHDDLATDPRYSHLDFNIHHDTMYPSADSTNLSDRFTSFSRDSMDVGGNSTSFSDSFSHFPDD